MKIKDTMTWNYRIFKYEKGGFGIHEAYYGDGKLRSWTVDPIITGNSIKDLLKTLEMIKKDILKSKKDIIKYEKKKNKT